VHALSGLLSDQDSLIRQNAVSALGEIGGENAMMYLLQARYDPDSIIRANADAILAELEYKAAY
jgi:HEAT repeat protein